MMLQAIPLRAKRRNPRSAFTLNSSSRPRLGGSDPTPVLLDPTALALVPPDTRVTVSIDTIPGRSPASIDHPISWVTSLEEFSSPMLFVCREEHPRGHG